MRSEPASVSRTPPAGGRPRATRFVLAGLLVGVLGCPAEPRPSTPASAPASAPASQPASAPASAPASRAASAPAIELDVAVATTTSISVDRLRRHVAVLAAPELEGRGAATRGLEQAARYLETEAKAIGLEPGFGASFRQPFEMTVATRVGAGSRLVTAGGRRLAPGPELAPFPFSSSARVRGPVSFAGFGIRARDLDYDDLDGLALTGRIAVVLEGEPGEDDPDSPFDGRRSTAHSGLRQKLLHAREAGAVGVLVVRDGPLDGPDPRAEPASDAGIVAARITSTVARALLGFDPIERRRAIDADHRPRSGPGPDAPIELAVEIERERRTVHNIVGVLRARTATEAVVLGAHYDHLGYGGAGSLAEDPGAEVHPGADDNASGTAAVLEVARALVAESRTRPLKRDVWFAWFAGEESGLLGSHHLVERPPLALGSVAAMVNLDMVGHLRDDTLNVMGGGSAPQLEPLARRVLEARGLRGSFDGDAYGPSDHTSFYAARVPVLFLFTGAHEHYHKPSDTPDTLLYPGLATAAAVAGDLVRALAAARDRPSYVELPAPPPARGGGGYGPYFGSIPDFGEQKDGVRLSGTRKGSPADRAGLTKGDVIVRFGGTAVKNLMDLTIALRASAPGDEVEVEWLRGGVRHVAKATLERRR